MHVAIFFMNLSPPVPLCLHLEPEDQVVTVSRFRVHRTSDAHAHHANSATDACEWFKDLMTITNTAGTSSLPYSRYVSTYLGNLIL